MAILLAFLDNTKKQGLLRVINQDFGLKQSILNNFFLKKITFKLNSEMQAALIKQHGENLLTQKSETLFSNNQFRCK